MYKGFKLDDFDNSFFYEPKYDLESYYYNKGKNLFLSNKKIIENKLDSFILGNGNLDGSKMQGNWFTKIKADVFISHSHDDKELAIALAGWLYDTFGLTSFIDSCIWGYADDLLKQIDDSYCKINTNFYNYDLLKLSSSHVHMMLSTALTMMIDNCECLFFLNTPNSLTTSGVINKTLSPWIYHELYVSSSIRIKPPDRHKKIVLSEIFREKQANILNIEYRLELEHLKKIKMCDLIHWYNMFTEYGYYRQYINKNTSYIHELDFLY